MKKPLLFIVIAAAVAGGVWLATSGSSTSVPAESVSPTPTPSRLPATSTKPTSTKTPTPSPTPSSIVHETHVHTVNIQNFAYSPSSVTVKRGDVVVFKNMDSTSHTVTADAGTFDSGLMSAGTEYSLVTANLAPGTYSFYCTYHPSMRGTIVVQ